jgi:hypothetical protein
MQQKLPAVCTKQLQSEHLQARKTLECFCWQLTFVTWLAVLTRQQVVSQVYGHECWSGQSCWQAACELVVAEIQ